MQLERKISKREISTGLGSILTVQVRISSYRTVSSFLRATACQFTIPLNHLLPQLPDLISSPHSLSPLRAMESIWVVVALILKQRKLKMTLFPKRRIFTCGSVSSAKLFGFLTSKFPLVKEIHLFNNINAAWTVSFPRDNL